MSELTEIALENYKVVKRSGNDPLDFQGIFFRKAGKAYIVRQPVGGGKLVILKIPKENESTYQEVTGKDKETILSKMRHTQFDRSYEREFYHDIIMIERLLGI